MNKKALTERDICTKYITPALKQAGWDEFSQIREEVSFTKGRIIVRGRLVTRGKAKRADYILYYKPSIPLALIEAKDNNHTIGDGIQQALEYAATLNIPFVFSSNGDGFLFHDRTGASPQKETTLPLESFPTPAGLWARYRSWKGITLEAEPIVLQDYFEDTAGKTPRYYQCNAVNISLPGAYTNTYTVTDPSGNTAQTNRTVVVVTRPVLTGLPRHGASPFQLTFTNTPGALFTVLATTNVALRLSNWTALGRVTEGLPGAFQFTDPAASNLATRYYRLRCP